MQQQIDIRETKIYPKPNVLRLAMPTKAMLLPALLFLTVVYVFPLVALMRLSFSQGSANAVEAIGFTWNNYIDFLADPIALKVMLRSLWIALASTVGSIALALPFATSLATIQSKIVRNTLITAALLPMTTSGVVRAYGLIMVLGSNGPINGLLMGLGFTSTPTRLLYGPIALVVGNIYFALPFVIFPLASAIGKIEKTLVEASASLGAVTWQTQWFVIAPLLIPALAAGSVISFTLSMTSYVTPGLLAGEGYLVATTLLGQQMFNMANWISGAVISTILLVLVVIVVAIYQYWLDKKAKFYE